jgi:redox-sensitive bicupin YhaK (pirin superfamily)
MSGPVRPEDAPPGPDRTTTEPPTVEITESREATVGTTRVRRALPRRGRRTVGAWCFADHMGPVDVDPDRGVEIGPHPHIGLHTVTWLLDGRLLHRDSLGSEQVIRPGQLNLMTAGHGVAHSEESDGAYGGTLEGVQLWVAQPDATRGGDAAFEHHATLPAYDLANGVATVLVGELDGTRSDARADTPLLGADLDLRGPVTLPLEAEWEYALVVLRGVAGVDGTLVEPGRLAYLGQGRDELAVDAPEAARALLLGGEPFPDPIVMWWNFVGRDRDDLAAAYASWHAGDDRFGRVASALPRIPAPEPYWTG